ncbi:XdhC family protein [Natrinema gelatinilyticum]|uniref:XdhC family protein n=1 Tax=Natrinema gelatinilyticum TaxID=2961571 RepID=UPI0020C59681|nr:XdhC/CoxI family protein [Natrinema gelatinilyticum]
MSEGTWSASESTVLNSVRQLLETEREGVLATIISVEGSAYRRPGAKMLVSAEGDGVGSITAGCVEDEVRSLATTVLNAEQPRVETFDLMADDDIWGLGIGCNGVIDILLEPLTEQYRPVIEAYKNDVAIASAIITKSDGGAVEEWTRVYYRQDNGIVTDDPLPGWFERELSDVASYVLEEDTSEMITIDGPKDEGSIEGFVDGIRPPPEVLVAGTGHDVRPLVELARKNDFRTTVVGFRGAAATKERFPEADTVVSTSPGNLRDEVDLDEETYAVVMTHNFIDDRLALDELIKSPVPYVGLMGPRERFEQMRDEFATEDRTFSDDDLETIYTPVGLSLGGGTPYQIAASITAEILAVHNEREPKHLKDREGPIHDRVDTEPLS